MQRRNFLKLCGAAGLGFAAPVGLSSMARGADAKSELPSYDGPYYVVFNAAGGWDTTYLMDPKGVNEMNRLYKEGDILTQGNHRLAPNAARIDGGMSNEDFFQKHGNDLLVLNGLDYSVNNHSPCSRYMATGKLDSLAYPTFAALVAACNGSEVPADPHPPCTPPPQRLQSTATRDWDALNSYSSTATPTTTETK